MSGIISPTQSTPSSAHPTSSTTTATTDASMQNPDSGPPLLRVEEDLMALARLGELRAIQKLFDSGKYTASYADEQGITALHWAAINGHHALCHFLLQAGANVNAKGGDAQATPVLWASKKCNLEVVNLLLQNGADPLITDDSGYNLLHCATLDGNVFQVVLLLHQPDIPVDIPDSQGHTSLMWAAYKGYPACVDLLLRWGANVKATDQLGFTALHWALVKGNYACIQKLVEYGSDRFAANNEGKTPAVTAKDMNHVGTWHRALADSGFDAEGNAQAFPLTFVRDQRKFIAGFFFVWPFFILGIALYIMSQLVIYTGVPIAMATAYGMQWLGIRLLKWAPSDMKHIHKTPFLAGIFSASLAWVGLRWIMKILPLTWTASPFLNLLFAISFGLCTYFYYLTMMSDPGFVPKGGSRGQQKDVIDELLTNGVFNEQNFCSICMIRKPLRSKHCRRCNRCVAKEDHHCPWVSNCIGVNNHRHFVLYTIFLTAGIGAFIRLTLNYLQRLMPEPQDHLQCTLLNEWTCQKYSADPFTFLTSIWAALQLTWVIMLLFVHLTQISRAMTTFESMRKHDHPHNPLATAITTGSTTLEGSQLGPAGAGPDPSLPPGSGAASHAHIHGQAQAQAQAHPRKQKEGCWSQWKKLLGLDTFIATALHGSKADEVLSRRRRNPFTHGVVRNCSDFWCDAGGARELFRRREDGLGMLGGERVDYRRLYEVPDSVGGMRYRSGGYESVGGEEV